MRSEQEIERALRLAGAILELNESGALQTPLPGDMARTIKDAYAMLGWVLGRTGRFDQFLETVESMLAAGKQNAE